MGLWFKKKIEKEEETLGSKTPDVKQAFTSTVAKDEPPVAPVPSPPSNTPRTFKLPPSNVAVSVDSAAPIKAATSSQAAAEAVAEAVRSQVEFESLYSPSAATSPVTEATSAVQSSPISAETQAEALGVKPILKPIVLKPRIQVADKTAVTPPKTEAVAADMPAVQRTDPKALYYQLMNGLYDVIFVLDDDGHVIDCNSRSEEIFGYSPDDVWNMPIEKIVYGMNNRMFNLLKKNLTNKRHILIDARCFRSVGTSFLGEVGVSTVQLTRSQNVVFSIRNVEKRKNSAEELRRYRAILDVLPIPAFTCDLHGAFEILNPPVLRALGMVDEMEAQKKHFSEMLPDMILQFQAAVRGADVCESKELTRPDGSVYTLELRLKPMRRGEEITGVAGTMTMT